MPIHKDKESGCYVLKIDRRFAGQRYRLNQVLPAAWSKRKAEQYEEAKIGEFKEIAYGLKRPASTIGKAVTLFNNHRADELKHGKRYSQELALILMDDDKTKDMDVSKLPEVCQKYAEKYKGDLQPATIRNRIRYLTSACRWAWKNYGIGEHDPGSRVSVPSVNNARQFYLTRGEVVKIARKAQHRDTRRLILVAFYSAMRLSEICRAKVVDGCFVLTDTKNGSPRIVPIHDKIAYIARKFPIKSRPRTMQGHWWVIRKACGYPHLHIHDLRHSAISSMINAGTDQQVVGAVAGHKSSVSIKRYSHLYTSTMASAINKIGKKVA